MREMRCVLGKRLLGRNDERWRIGVFGRIFFLQFSFFNGQEFKKNMIRVRRGNMLRFSEKRVGMCLVEEVFSEIFP